MSDQELKEKLAMIERWRNTAQALATEHMKDNPPFAQCLTAQVKAYNQVLLIFGAIDAIK